MIETAVWAAVLVAVAVIAFGISVRFGMLLGRRLDGALEARAWVGDSPGEAVATPADAGPNDRSSGWTEPSRSRDMQAGESGQEEARGE